MCHCRCETVEAGAKAQCRLHAAEARLQYRCGSKAAVPQRDRGGRLPPWLYHLTQPLHSHREFGKPSSQVSWTDLRKMSDYFILVAAAVRLVFTVFLHESKHLLSLFLFMKGKLSQVKKVQLWDGRIHGVQSSLSAEFQCEATRQQTRFLSAATQPQCFKCK